MAQNDQSSGSEEQVDLAIIGGGPTGLLSALLASRLGLSVKIIDAKPGPLEVGRADALNARTQQYLEVVGILNELLPLGIKCNTSSTFSEGDFKSRQSHWWTSLQHCFHPNFLMVGQSVVEKVLRDHLDIPVHYQERVTNISETECGVTLNTDRGRKVLSKYAIAADGARSTVRQALNINFAGTKPEMVWAVLDTFIDTDFPVCSEIITFQLRGQSRISWIPRERGMARFYVLLDGEITQRKAEDSIREHMAPHRVDFVKTEWFSTFDVKERIASTFVSKQGDGRIILAGDAAHVHSVNGGQGLNTGIADAFALSWRVVAAVKNAGLTHGAATKLIRSYDTERRAVAQEVIDVAAALVRDTVHTAKQYVSTIEKNAGYITGMGVSYDGIGSEIIAESERGIWKAGKRCPDIWVTPIGSNEATRLYSITSYGKYLILFLGAQDIQKLFGNICTYFILRPSDAAQTETNGHDNGSNKQPGIFLSDVVTSEDNFVVVWPKRVISAQPRLGSGRSVKHDARNG
ncbi:FAD binding domain-containing protein [Annulohypoxylon truncatum]|uniref:FAD binding domain-containing protein n=1 Tax=Annulohypoxylon truncatum TaxID=327061 RepID=UPI002007D230|nr:FAD binding domain-containing protein [Annulohypoxylon truncatum]KAI1212016.1 FAD binding domain-containing protein [Annulohypoxylon truncatum]